MPQRNDGIPRTIIEHVEIIEDNSLCTHDIARLCNVSPQWVIEHVEQDILHAQNRDGTYYFSTAMVWRARTIADLEDKFDADPQLAALVADLTEELHLLRNRLSRIDDK